MIELGIINFVSDQNDLQPFKSFIEFKKNHQLDTKLKISTIIRFACIF